MGHRKFTTLYSIWIVKHWKTNGLLKSINNKNLMVENLENNPQNKEFEYKIKLTNLIENLKCKI